MSTWNGGEACSVQIRRSMIVYYKNQRIMLSLSANTNLINTIINEVPEYFLVDKSVCQGHDSWSRGTGEGDSGGSLDFFPRLNG